MIEQRVSPLGTITSPSSRAFVLTMAGVAVALPAIALVGWSFDVLPLRSIFPRTTTINPTSALCLLALGVALALTQRSTPAKLRPSPALAVLVGGLMALKLVDLAGFHLPVDRLLFPTKIDLQRPPSRIAPQTALELGTTALMLWHRSSPDRDFFLAPLLRVTNGLIAVLALAGYFFGAERLYGLHGFIPMAPASALAILALNVGLAAGDPKNSVARILSKPGAGGALARRLVPLAILLPLLIGAVRVALHRSRYIDFGTTTALLTLGHMAVAVWLTLYVTNALDRSHAEILALDRERGHRERLAMIGQLSAGVAHEINNPLAYLLTNLNWLRDEQRAGTLSHPDTEELGSVLADAIEGAERVKVIVADMKAFARSDAAEADSQQAACDPAEALREALRMAKARLDRAARVDVEVTPSTPRVPMSHQQLSQSLLNLLVNAADAVEHLGEDQAQIKVFCGSRDGAVCVSVADNGPGIPPEVAAKLFQPFFTTKAADKGTGLGLSLSREFVTRAGGTLALVPSPQGGATFELRLPAA